MTGKELFKGVSYIDEELLGEVLDTGSAAGVAASGEDRKTISVRGSKRRRNWTQYAAMVAALAIVVLIGSATFRNGLFGRKMNSAVPASASASASSGSSAFVPESETVSAASGPQNDLYYEGTDQQTASQSNAPVYVAQTEGDYVTVTALPDGSTYHGIDQPVEGSSPASEDPDSYNYRQIISSYGNME